MKMTDPTQVVASQLQAIALVQNWTNDPGFNARTALLPQDFPEAYLMVVNLAEMNRMILDTWHPGEQKRILAILREHIMRRNAAGDDRPKP